MTMRRGAAKFVFGGMLTLAVSAGAARLPDRIVDPGLHRQWLIERDRAHPERPARLVEVPWSRGGPVAGGSPTGQNVRRPVVRAGMSVTLWRRNPESVLRLAGTALEPGGMGEAIRVRAGLHGSVLRGVVRGPALVELEPGRR